MDTFHVDAVIVHDVPQNNRTTPADNAITYSEAPIPGLAPAQKNFFRERINRSLAGHAYSVERDPIAGSRVPELIAQLLAEPDKLVPLSQEMARALYAAQNLVNSPGLLTVITGTIDCGRAAAILKLQRHQGVQMHIIETDEGRRTFSADILEDLTLTEETRTFKASIFRPDEGAPGAIDGKVSDDQRGYDPHAEVAAFFLSRFLGCRLRTAPDVATKQFYEAAREYIGTIPDLELRLDYGNALVATLRSPQATVIGAEFADEFLATEHRQGFVDHLRERGVPDITDKKTNLIDARLKRAVIRTSRKLRIQGPIDVLDEIVHFEPATDDHRGRKVIDDTLEELDF